MKSGGKRKATSEAPNEVVGPSDDVGVGGGEGWGVQVQNFEGKEGTQLRKSEGEEPHVEDSEGEGEEEEEDDEGVVDGEEDEEAEEGNVAVGDGARGQGGQPGVLLAENFYEVEAIRRKRVRKGQVQYFIKWRDWPETANTWEPPENLESVRDVVEAFEENLKSGKHRKRKRKHVVHHTQPKKRLERSTTPYSLRRFSTSAAENHTQSVPLNDPSLPDIPAFPQAVLFADDVGNGAEGSSLGKAAPGNVNKSANGLEPHIERNEENDYDPTLSELKATTPNGNDTNRPAVRIPEAKIFSGPGPSGNNCQIDAKSKGVSTETGDSGRCRGSKRRKSGSVKRFKKELYVGGPVNTENPVGTAVGTAEPAETMSADSAGNHARPASNIVRILKPVGYSASVASGAQDVLVTFVATKSDGTEVMVDNKYLKAFNPLLLINFYEQHLRYSPTS
ncbi:hypothetical protein VNO78_26298 [Psophocarpus tetragonolobus]|uniref:Chromo domain-containing protein n=1 Tax=Psophocarpus tetragonolobus TaxID=3891 RepID=A0AAN9X8U4_PSOTE